MGFNNRGNPSRFYKKALGLDAIFDGVPIEEQPKRLERFKHMTISRLLKIHLNRYNIWQLKGYYLFLTNDPIIDV